MQGKNGRGFMRWLCQGVVTGWLLFLSFWIWLIEFNDYRDFSIVDYDKDAEVAFIIFLFLLWLTTLFVWIVNLIGQYGLKTKPLWFISGLSAILSIAFIPKFMNWMQYNAEVAKLCQ